MTTLEAQNSPDHDLPAPKIGAAALDLVLVLGTLLFIKYSLLQIDMLWTYAGPLAILSAVAMAGWRLRKNNESWADLGLGKPNNFRKLLMWSLGILAVTTFVGIVVDNVLLTANIGGPENVDARYSDRFADLPGNTASYIYWLAVAWIVGGFAEEMLCRGMLISRFERLFAKFPFSLLIAVLLQSVIFGQQHYYYQGLNGALANGAIALVSGGFYILSKRNLWPLTISHGLANTIGLTLIYTGVQPVG